MEKLMQKQQDEIIIKLNNKQIILFSLESSSGNEKTSIYLQKKTAFNLSNNFTMYEAYKVVFQIGNNSIETKWKQLQTSVELFISILLQDGYSIDCFSLNELTGYEERSEKSGKIRV